MPKIKYCQVPADSNLPNWLFYCPACKCDHGIWTAKENRIGAKWTLRGDVECPTVTPSLLLQFSKMTDKGLADLDAWEKAGYPDRKSERFESKDFVCHVVITAGILNYQPDCTHELAGKAVPMVDYDTHE